VSAYGPLSAAFYDADKPVAGEAEIAWYASRLPRDAGTLLEAMCGSGRLLLPLAQAGFKLHGVDSSAAMLASCEARLRAAGQSPVLFRQDIAGLNVPFRYAAAFIAAGSFQLLTDPLGARLALERLRAHLLPGALLLLDLVVPDEARHPPGAPRVDVRSVRLADGGRITLRGETQVDAQSKLIEYRYRYERREPARPIVREDEELSLTWYERDDITTLVGEAGFADVAIEPPAFGDGVELAFAVSARVRS